MQQSAVLGCGGQWIAHDTLVMLAILGRRSVRNRAKHANMTRKMSEKHKKSEIRNWSESGQNPLPIGSGQLIYEEDHPRLEFNAPGVEKQAPSLKIPIS